MLVILRDLIEVGGAEEVPLKKASILFSKPSLKTLLIMTLVTTSLYLKRQDTSMKLGNSTDVDLFKGTKAL